MKNQSPWLDHQVLIYLGILVVLAAVTMYASRNILFRPWTSRRWVSAVSADEKIYTIGGINKYNRLEDDIICIDLKENTLKRTGKLPSPRYGAGSAIIGGKLYIAGGYDFHVYLDQILVFDPEEKELRQIGTLPGPRAFGQLVAVNGFLYYISGWNGKKITDDIIKIDPDSGETASHALSFPPMELFTACIYKNIVYIIGGENTDRENVNILYKFDPEKNTVLAEGVLPQSRCRVPAAVQDDTLYIIGGWDGGVLTDILKGDCTAAELELEYMGEFKDDSSDLALVSSGDFLYLLGGTESRYRRQLRIIQIDPEDFSSTSLILKSYSWW